MPRRPRTLTDSWKLRLIAGGSIAGMLAASFGYPFPSGAPDMAFFWIGLLLFVAGTTWLFHKTSMFTLASSVMIGSIGFAAAWGVYGVFTAEDGSGFVSGNQSIEGVVVVSEPSSKHQKLVLEVEEVDDRLQVFVPRFPEWSYGDKIRFSCELEVIEPFDGFRYDRYMATRDIYHACFLRDAPLLVEERQGEVSMKAFADAHDAIVEQIELVFGEPHAALLSGLLLGDQNFSDSWEERFRRTGTTHIVAASGYNVTVVSYVLFGLLVYFGVRRQYAYAVLLAGITVYVFLAGADAPIVRAGIMGALVLTAKQLGRKTTMTNILLITVAVMLLIEPRVLRDDVGFQLSVLSTVGLIYASSKVESWFQFVPKTFTLRESLAATVTATLFTLPVTLFSFGQLSVVSPIANLLILPAIPYAMALGGFAIILSLIHPVVGFIASGPAWALLSYVFWMVEALSSIPFASFEL